MRSRVDSGRGFFPEKGEGVVLGIGEPHFDAAVGQHTELVDEPELAVGVVEGELDELVEGDLFAGRLGLVEFDDVEAGVAASGAEFPENDIAEAAAGVVQWFAAVSIVLWVVERRICSVEVGLALDSKLILFEQDGSVAERLTFGCFIGT